MAHVARVATSQDVRLPQFRLSSLSPGCHRDLGRRQRTISFRANEVQAQVASGRFWRGRLEASGPASRRLRLAVEAATLLSLIAASRPHPHEANYNPVPLTRLSGIRLYIGKNGRAMEQLASKMNLIWLPVLAPKAPPEENPSRVAGSSFQQAGAV